jgi:energy-coupling factor transporter ATP-binding protein EcfA2
MKLAAIVLENFRGYRSRTRIELADLTALIGKNDSGKSTIFEALEIFFNDGKIEQSDSCAYGEEKKVRIGCVFKVKDMPIVIDAKAATTLDAEHLLNRDGELEIIKEWDTANKAPRERLYAVALHPVNQGAKDLLTLKISELKDRFKEVGANANGVKLTTSWQIRNAIRAACEPLELVESFVPLEKEDGKEIWDELKKELPLFALFRSDRPSQDGDGEVQDPLKFAISEALRELAPELERITAAVRDRATEVAERTLEKLKEIDGNLAVELKPFFKADPKWDVFKIGLVGESGIPINKRGSGVRRLILLSFFRAEAERKRAQKKAVNVIYAIEEPETSQHPLNQRLLVGALKDLASDEHVQVLVTSHTPGLAGLLPSESLRRVRKAADGTSTVAPCSEEDLADIAGELGILPDRRVQVLVCVEGPNDIEFLERISSKLKLADPEIISFLSEHRVALLPLGGGTLKHWVAKRYLRNLHIPEVHFYDRDDLVPPKYQEACDAVNALGDGSWAVISSKREMENYLHRDAISALDGIDVPVADDDDIPLMVAKALHQRSESEVSWDDVARDDKKLADKVGRAKKRLNTVAADCMTFDMLKERDPNDEFVGWLRRISAMLVA